MTICDIEYKDGKLTAIDDEHNRTLLVDNVSDKLTVNGLPAYAYDSAPAKVMRALNANLMGVREIEKETGLSAPKIVSLLNDFKQVGLITFGQYAKK